MKSYYLLWCCLAWGVLATAQNGVPPTPGARGQALGGSGLTFSDVNSVLSNQAGMAGIEAPAVAFNAEQRFLLQEIRSLSAAFAYPTKSGTFGLSVNYFGFEAYNEQRIGLAYGRKLLDNLSLGAQIVTLNTIIPEYGSEFALTFELGLLLDISKTVKLGVHTFSPMRVKVLPDEDLPSILRVGLSYRPAPQLLVLAEAEKDLLYPVRARVGVEYALVEAIHLRAGLATQPVQMSFGMGFRLQNGINLDVASSYHQLLGFTPGFSFGYRF